MNPHGCPICLGRGFVPNGFYSTQTGYWSGSSTLANETCRTCMGTGIVWEPTEIRMPDAEGTDASIKWSVRYA